MIGAALAIGACSSSSGHPAGPTSTIARPPSRARIESFVVPASVKCGRGPSTNVPVRYTVTGSRRRQVIVDGRADLRPHPAHGRLVERVHCNGLRHSISLVAFDATGGRTSAVKFVTTVVPG